MLLTLYRCYIISALDKRFKKVCKIAIKHAKREILHLEVPSSDEDDTDSMANVRIKKKGSGSERKITISMSGMMAQVMQGQERVEARMNKLEANLETKMDSFIETVGTLLKGKAITKVNGGAGDNNGEITSTEGRFTLNNWQQYHNIIYIQGIIKYIYRKELYIIFWWFNISHFKCYDITLWDAIYIDINVSKVPPKLCSYCMHDNIQL